MTSSDQRPLVSVVVPTRDRARLLHMTLRSITSQQNVRLEVVVVDDGSSAPSDVLDTVAEATRRSRSTVDVVRHERSLGRSRARNRGVAEARGQWIAFCDDDDLWAPDKLAAQLDAATAARAGWVYTGSVMIDDRLRILHGAAPPNPERLVEELATRNTLPAGASNVLARASVIAQAGRFDATLRRTEDWDLWLRMAQVAGAPARVGRPLVAYRAHFGAARMDVSSMIDETEMLAQRHGLRLNPADALRRAGWSCLEAGQRLAAARWYARASRWDPTSLARLGVALVHPAVGTPELYRLVRQPSDAQQWQQEARDWLRALTATTG